MKFSVTHLWAHLWVYLWALLAATSAQPMKYIEEGGTLSLKPDVSTIQKPIRSIIWRNGLNWVVDWMAPDDIKYYGSYINRTHLNIETVQLDIHHLTLADSGTFSLETDKGTVRTYPVQVILSPPKPRLLFNPTVCDQDQPCAVMCDVETLHLGPVTFYWRRNDGEWRPDNKQVTLSRPEYPETITCRLATPLQDSESSLPRDNPLYAPPPPPPPPLWIIGLIVFILIVAAVVFLLVKYFSRKLKRRSANGNIMKVETSGASWETAQQDGLNSAGVEASHKMAHTDADRMAQYKTIIQRVALKHGVDPAVVAAIISRQSRAGEALGSDGWGDHGNSFGLMQVNVDPNGGGHTAEGQWNIEPHLNQGTGILVDYIQQIEQKFPTWSAEQKLKGAIAAYIAGVGNVHSYEGVDELTAGKDFSNDVVARAQWYKQQGY